MKIWKEKDAALKIIVWKADFRFKKKRYRPKAFSKGDLDTLIIGIKANAENEKYGLAAASSSKITLGELLARHSKEYDLSKKNDQRSKRVVDAFRQKNRQGNTGRLDCRRRRLRLYPLAQGQPPETRRQRSAAKTVGSDFGQ